MNKELESLLKQIRNKIENTKATISDKTARTKNLQADIVHLEVELGERLEAERMLLGLAEPIVEDTGVTGDFTLPSPGPKE